MIIVTTSTTVVFIFARQTCLARVVAKQNVALVRLPVCPHPCFTPVQLSTCWWDSSHPNSSLYSTPPPKQTGQPLLSFIDCNAVLVCSFFLPMSHLYALPQTQLGITKVNITVLEAAGASAASLHFINVHQNENTSVVAAKALMYFVGGYLFKHIS